MSWPSLYNEAYRNTIALEIIFLSSPQCWLWQYVGIIFSKWHTHCDTLLQWIICQCISVKVHRPPAKRLFVFISVCFSMYHSIWWVSTSNLDFNFLNSIKFSNDYDIFDIFFKKRKRPIFFLNRDRDYLYASTSKFETGTSLWMNRMITWLEEE